MFGPLEHLSAEIQYEYLISGDYLILPVSLTFIAASTGLTFYSDFVVCFVFLKTLYGRIILNKDVNCLLDLFVFPLSVLGKNHHNLFSWHFAQCPACPNCLWKSFHTHNIWVSNWNEYINFIHLFIFSYIMHLWSQSYFRIVNANAIAKSSVWRESILTVVIKHTSSDLY